MQPTITSKNPNLCLVSSLSSPCHFPSYVFLDVMHNLIRNPNITSSHLFRADILYDSVNDATYNPQAIAPIDVCGLAKHMQVGLRPRLLSIEGFELSRTIVRRLIPCNANLDKPLVQTCHVYESAPASTSRKDNDGAASTLVVYLPHAEEAEMPWYHPKVKALAFLHSEVPLKTGTSAEPDIVKNRSNSTPVFTMNSSSYSVSLHLAPFASTAEHTSVSFEQSIPDTNRLDRTLKKFLQTILRHGHGRQAGYQKRVQHDVLVPQARFQDTYTRLKLKYAKEAVMGWEEKTDPTKHVFEDLGIAAFLIELWRTMYSSPTFHQVEHAGDNPLSTPRDPTPLPCLMRGSKFREASFMKSARSKPPHDELAQTLPTFPGFVDIGCGNGLLVHLLLSEGYSGGGFDVRARKSWATYPSSTQCQLREAILVPSIFRDTPGYTESSKNSDDSNDNHLNIIDGTFEPGTFIISNHADEVTLWTPLLARLSGGCPFLAIPCCSHDLSGARTRFSARAAAGTATKEGRGRSQELGQPEVDDSGGKLQELALHDDDEEFAETASSSYGSCQGNWESRARSSDASDHSPPSTSQTKGTTNAHKPSRPPSAYSTLCTYTERLSRDAGYTTQREMLRIPSTRNVGIVGTYRSHDNSIEKNQGFAVDGRSDMETKEDAEAQAQERREVLGILAAEMPGRSLEDLAKDWWARVEKIRGGKGVAH